MEKVSNFINVIQTINVTSKPCYYSWKDRSIIKGEITEDEKHLYDEVYYYVITIKKETEVRALLSVAEVLQNHAVIVIIFIILYKIRR